ncbi:MAG: UDP-3-O-acyl-N-acetylglucosamine deacetylase [Algiphilus sp.]|uniref:UDP-3-O-acyl-N-acetylglucosamine deacetylase n=1 Tax=Algiphilus sp. TaxID=1872431 RepID=UPI0032EDC41E
MVQQRTLKNPIRASGVGLHSGRKVFLSMQPAAPDTGIIFRRIDLPGAPEIPAQAHLVTDTQLCTCLTNEDGHKIQTIEHLLSALSGMGVDNAIIELSAPEVPIMDGSAGPFVFLLQSAGVVEQAAPKQFLRVKRPVQVQEGDKLARLEPANGFRLSFGIEFDHPVVSGTRQHVTVDFSSTAFVREVARARTFGFMQDVEFMRARNLALGGSLENAVVLDEFRVLNRDGLRYDDEFVRHKILDAVGDLYLVGHSILGAYSAFKSGHDLNNKLARKLLEDEGAWELVTVDDAADAPVQFGPALPATA